MSETDSNKQTAAAAFEALMSGDLQALPSLLTENCVLHQCGFLEPIPAGAILSGRFPGNGPVRDRTVRLERMVEEGEYIALHWITEGLHVAPEEEGGAAIPVRFPSMTFLRMETGKIAEIWNIQDRATLETQLWEAGQER